MVLGGFLEFILGNTFPFVVFSSFGAFWLTYGATLQSFYGAISSYAEGDTPGNETVGFNASLAFFLVFMGLLCLVYLICSLRTNLVFFIIFLTLVVAFGLLAGAFWQNANAYGSTDAAYVAKTAALASRLQIVSILLNDSPHADCC